MFNIDSLEVEECLTTTLQSRSCSTSKTNRSPTSAGPSSSFLAPEELQDLLSEEDTERPSTRGSQRYSEKWKKTSDENSIPPSSTETRIASTAIVRGIVGEGCVVEDFAVIGPDVVLGDRCFVGNYSRLHGKLKAGNDNVFYDNVSIGNPPQDFFGSRSDGQITIGNHCVLREFVSVNMPTEGETRIGNL